MRFIFNFIFFGILFYLIYLFFPDAFHTLVSWVNQIYLFLKDLFMQVTEKVHQDQKHINPTSTETASLMTAMGTWMKSYWMI